MANWYRDNDDLRWYMTTGVDWEPLVRLTEVDWQDPEGFRTVSEALEFYDEVLDSVGTLAAEEIFPHARTLDETPTRLEDGEVVVPAAMDRIFGRIAGMGLHSLCLPRSLDGMNAPLLVYFLGAEMIARADVGVMTHHSFHGGMAMAMLVYSLQEGSTTLDSRGQIVSTRFAEEMKEIGRGEAWGCMDITEPHAGSDMAQIRTRAELGADGVWRLTGQKVYITSGHGKYHFVIARTDPDPSSGLEGLSFFLVRMWEDTPEGRRRHATIGRVEEKMGHHSSATCQIDFENTPAELVGKVGEGFRQMLLLMNNARVGVSFESIGLAESAYRQAASYAAERPSMGKTIDRHEMIADMLEEMQTDIVGLRALTVHAAWQEEMSQKLRLGIEHQRGRITESDRQLYDSTRREARRVTPLAKYACSEKAVEIARKAIQIHGGAGYTRDYGVEKLLRDALVLPIYEGTSQIQALMSMKDSLVDVIRRPAAFAEEMATARWRSLAGGDEDERMVWELRWRALRARQVLISRTAAGRFASTRHLPFSQWPDAWKSNWDPKRDFSWAMLHAERLIRLETDATIAELLLRQAHQDARRRIWLQRWLERAAWRTRHDLDRILHTGGRLLDTLRAATGTAAAAE